mmetsp:Transcript_15214/g.43158  ORF Transcript_15214/g.43158 Transcript_15214/m.43158 type:complete len:305 (-) Transcript_15214:121-1035(-)
MFAQALAQQIDRAKRRLGTRRPSVDNIKLVGALHCRRGRLGTLAFRDVHPRQLDPVPSGEKPLDVGHTKVPGAELVLVHPNGAVADELLVFVHQKRRKRTVGQSLACISRNELENLDMRVLGCKLVQNGVHLAARSDVLFVNVRDHKSAWVRVVHLIQEAKLLDVDHAAKLGQLGETLELAKSLLAISRQKLLVVAIRASRVVFLVSIVLLEVAASQPLGIRRERNAFAIQLRTICGSLESFLILHSFGLVPSTHDMPRFIVVCPDTFWPSVVLGSGFGENFAPVLLAIVHHLLIWVWVLFLLA